MSTAPWRFMTFTAESAWASVPAATVTRMPPPASAAGVAAFAFVQERRGRHGVLLVRHETDVLAADSVRDELFHHRLGFAEVVHPRDDCLRRPALLEKFPESMRSRSKGDANVLQSGSAHVNGPGRTVRSD